MMYDQLLIFNTKHNIYFYLIFCVGNNEYFRLANFSARLRKNIILEVRK